MRWSLQSTISSSQSSFIMRMQWIHNNNYLPVTPGLRAPTQPVSWVPAVGIVFRCFGCTEFIGTYQSDWRDILSIVTKHNQISLGISMLWSQTLTEQFYSTCDSEHPEIPNTKIARIDTQYYKKECIQVVLQMAFWCESMKPLMLNECLRWQWSGWRLWGTGRLSFCFGRRTLD